MTCDNNLVVDSFSIFMFVMDCEALLVLSHTVVTLAALVPCRRLKTNFVYSSLPCFRYFIPNNRNILLCCVAASRASLFQINTEHDTKCNGLVAVFIVVSTAGCRSTVSCQLVTTINLQKGCTWKTNRFRCLLISELTPYSYKESRY